MVSIVLFFSRGFIIIILLLLFYSIYPQNISWNISILKYV